MDFIYYRKIKQFTKRRLRDLSKQTTTAKKKKAATGEPAKYYRHYVSPTYILCSLLAGSAAANKAALWEDASVCRLLQPMFAVGPTAIKAVFKCVFSAGSTEEAVSLSYSVIPPCVTRNLPLWKFTESNLISLMWSGAGHAGSPYAN